MITSEQVRAARALLRWEQADLARASGVSLPSVKRIEGKTGPLAAQRGTVEAIRRAFEAAGIVFLAAGEPAPGGGIGVRMAA
jgi:transcriptional regulator with XRE-family HTH domain